MTMPRAVTIQPAHAALDAYYHTLDKLKTTQAASSEGNLRRAFGTLLSEIVSRSNQSSLN
ncbi:MAG: hypothetical protein H7X77_10060 [Anaerolineae bacterium]|nr:hypothetical protein [Anaerolineae bacterium]